MQFTTDQACPTSATRSDLVKALCNPECMLYPSTVDMTAKTPSFDTLSREPAATTNKETPASFIERAMAVHAVKEASKDMNGTVVNSNSDTTD